MKILAVILSLVIFPFILFGQRENKLCTNKNELNKNWLDIHARRGHPYSIFNKNASNFNFDSCLSKIRLEIKKDTIASAGFKKNLSIAYSRVYNHAIQGKPGDDGLPKEGVSDLARWAYHNAFVYIIGANIYGEKLADSVRVEFRNCA